jgi:hypothetical protein
MPVELNSVGLDTNQALTEEFPDGVKATNYLEDYLFKLFTDITNINVANFNDAPADGLRYLRKDNTWVLLISVVTVTTTAHTAGDEDAILVDDDTAGGIVTVALPAAADRNATYSIKKLGTTASVIIDADGAETIDGTATIALTLQFESVTLLSDGTNWHII